MTIAHEKYTLRSKKDSNIICKDQLDDLRLLILEIVDNISLLLDFQ